MKKAILGYKSFDESFKDISGNILKEGNCYHVDGEIKFGINGNGYHFAKNLEDTLRYQVKGEYNLVNPKITQVLGYGKIVESFDDYYGYYDLYASSDIKILKYLTRDEIIDYALKLNSYRMTRFISLYKLTKDEIRFFKEKYLDVSLAILYFQKCQLDIYKIYYNSLFSEQNKKKLKQLIQSI